MSGLDARIKAFVKLGSFLRDYVAYSTGTDSHSETPQNGFEELDRAMVQAKIQNGWFTPENLLHSLSAWGDQLTEERLSTWLSAYDIKERKASTTAIIPAGNIPLVGFHDYLSALITGNKVLVKSSSKDKVLLPFLDSLLAQYEPDLKGFSEFTEGTLKDFDSVIATGSNNTARYFEYYFGKKPHIIRKNRNSVAVIKGNESHDELELLANDVFRYFGLGCRSVSKVFLPTAYDLDHLFKAFYKYRDLINHDKYLNNYEYNKAVYLMSEYDFRENGFLMLKEDSGYASPIATLFYEYYDSEDELRDRLHQEKDQIQCIVSNGFTEDEVAFGQTQQPGLTDYADGVDTVEFLLRN